MAEGDPSQSETDVISPRRPRWRRKRWWVPNAVLALVAMLTLVAWLSRERIAIDVIEDQLEAYGVPATYEITRIGGQRQVLSNVVVGDPAAPDFTAETVEVEIRWRFGTPEIGRITVTRPRLFGSYRDGTLSFGALDPLLFRETGEPPGLPEIDVAIRDGRGLLETDFGPMGIKLEGEGPIADGFDGVLAIAAPDLVASGCAIGGASAYGQLSTAGGEPRFQGPLRAATIACPEAGVSLERVAARVDATSDAAFDMLRGQISLDTGEGRYGEYALAGLNGSIRASWREGVLDARHIVAARGIRTPQALAALVTFDGTIRAGDGFEQVQLRSDIEGNGLRSGPSLESGIASLSRVGEGTLVAPLARQFAAALRREARGSAFAADLTARVNGERLTVLLPRAEMRGGSGARLLSLSQVELSSAGGGPATISGNIASAGSGLPRLTGRMEREPGGDTVFRLAMDEYSAGGSSLAIPQMTVAQAANGALDFSGRVVASGPLPGGSTRNLRLPVSGRYGPGGELALWRECTALGFDRLELAQLVFERRDVTLCPAPGSAIVRSSGQGVRIAAGAPSLDIVGMLGGTPIRIASGPVGFAYPGVMTARALDVTLGPADTANRFTISNLDARLGSDISGRFADADVTLDAVPLDIRETSGTWRYADGVLTLADGEFRLFDREESDRFEPLIARDASLTLQDNVITAFAELRHPESDRIVTSADIRHDLATGGGHADLATAGLLFDEDLQPGDLTVKAIGVVANTRGTVTGRGRIDWGGEAVTSTGSYSTEDLDFAAAFGPVRGASGTIVFSDLLGLTTAPGQSLRVASVNPGIEVADGVVEFGLREGQFLSVAGATFPFMGGQLILRETDLNFGVEEQRRYVFEIVGLDAGVFVQQLDIGNVSATGIFDGTVPIVFDASGDGRIEQGLLISRPPGGNISYVGELTYEDLSPIANFAFDSLRSLDYSQMRVVMDGPLTGEIITRLRFDGVRQGEGAETNFITRRLANLPLQFRINITAQFYQLITSVRSLYDPAAIRDPRELGLLSDDGTRLLRREITGEEAQPDIEPDDLVPDKPNTNTAIQRQESE
ncbi:YdbH domain-containing protein [Qipengyuania sp. MTN3-11]|uniref:intermembrane phospholipid transport protein YdbH family protein n=1 Tax=Qipengyuania sp. MTN3-11 TaxID=3056557 RepID=UPI0036F1D85B